MYILYTQVKQSFALYTYIKTLREISRFSFITTLEKLFRTRRQERVEFTF